MCCGVYQYNRINGHICWGIFHSSTYCWTYKGKLQWTDTQTVPKITKYSQKSWITKSSFLSMSDCIPCVFVSHKFIFWLYIEIYSGYVWAVIVLLRSDRFFPIVKTEFQCLIVQTIKTNLGFLCNKSRYHGYKI